MEDFKVEDAMTRDYIKAKASDNVIDIAKKMKSKDIGSMLICDKNKLVGLITSEDLVKRVILKSKDPKKLIAKDVMTKKLTTTTSDEELGEAIRIMIDEGVQRLPVMDGKKLVGILTDGDILRIAPHLVESLVEMREREMGMEGGSCEICGNYSEDLRKNGGVWVCEECYESSPKL